VNFKDATLILHGQLTCNYCLF